MSATAFYAATTGGAICALSSVICLICAAWRRDGGLALVGAGLGIATLVLLNISLTGLGGFIH